jgi:hypothetical protein
MGKRQYTMSATRAGFNQTVYFAEREWLIAFSSTARLRHFSCMIFQHIFGGLRPTTIWVGAGEAMLFDKRGNHLCVSQTNWFHKCSKSATTMPRPLCPMIISK